MSFVKYEPKGNIAYLIIEREKALNALNSQVLADLDAALDAVDLSEIRCLIVRGAGENGAGGAALFRIAVRVERDGKGVEPGEAHALLRVRRGVGARAERLQLGGGHFTDFICLHHYSPPFSVSGASLAMIFVLMGSLC